MSEATALDVIVAGAGPGGSSVSARLAEQGMRVLVIEKDEFPRFHIGESLLPAAESLVSVLGVEIDESVFLFKRGAKFVCEATGREATFDFSDALPGPQRYAWHVDRAKFDTLLRDRARALGADIRHGERVMDVRFDASGVDVDITAEDGARRTERARYFIDASGQGRLLATKMRTGKPLRRFGKAAVFTHFFGLSGAARAAIGPENDIRIMMVPDGWAWIIPLAGDRLSVGLVRRGQGIRKDDLDAYLASSPLLGRLTAGARRGDTHLIGNYSYKNARPMGARHACVGDAWGFIDPVFSSGVSLAIKSGIEVAERLVPALREGREGDPELMADIDRYLERGFDAFCALVDRFYNTRFVDNMIFGAPEDGALKAGVISVLAGDVYGSSDNRFLDMLFSARRRRGEEGGEVEVPEMGEGDAYVQAALAREPVVR